MSLSTVFIKMDCPQKFVWYIPKPSYHAKNQDVVIISTDCEELNKKGIRCMGVYEYDMKKNTLNRIHTYESTFSPYNHGQFIDPQNELLYIFGNKIFGIFDLNTNLMNTNTKSALRDCKRCPQSTYIPPINEFHILSDHIIHYTMDMSNKNINKMIIDKFENKKIRFPNILYV
eukprot:382031_1